jgi:hypothetical protein
MLRILDVLDSNLSLETDNPDQGVTGCPQFILANAEIILKTG